MAAFRVRMPPAQREQAEWAVDPMADYAESPEDGANYGPEDVPTIEGAELVFPSDRAVPDILYRLEVQLADMGDTWAESESEAAAQRGAVRAGANLADKIRDASGYRGPPWYGPEPD